jgi:hypothetical protein
MAKQTGTGGPNHPVTITVRFLSFRAQCILSFSAWDLREMPWRTCFAVLTLTYPIASCGLFAGCDNPPQGAKNRVNRKNERQMQDTWNTAYYNTVIE